MTKEFRRRRQKGIGGSDVAGILGLSRWTSPLQVYLNKVQEVDEQIENDFIKWGKILEDPIAKEFSAQTGKKVKVCNKTLISKEHDFLIAHIDRDIVGECAGLECKTANQFKKSEWTNGVPTEYLLQCMHYMYVTNSDYWYLAVLVGGNHFDWYKIDRDQDLIDKIIPKLTIFWTENVLKMNPPEPNHNDAQTINDLFGEPVDNAIKLNADVEPIIANYIELQQSIKNLTDRKTELENQIKYNLGEHTKGELNQFQVLWTPQTMNRFDTDSFKKVHPDLYSKFKKESSFRKFKIKEQAQ